MKTLAPYLIRFLWVALLLPRPAAISAQSVESLAPGDQVRVTWRTFSQFSSMPSRRTEYLELVRLDESQLVGVRGGQLVIVDARSIRRVERRIGTKPASAPAMVIGSGVGFAAGFLVGALEASANAAPGGVGAADAGLSTGVLIGAPLGALVAWIASRSHGIYEQVSINRVRPVASVAPSGRVGLGMSVNAR